MTLSQLRRKVEKTKGDIDALFFAELDRLARRYNLDEMMFTAYSTTLTRNGKEVKLKSIEALENLFNEEWHAQGFEGYWTKETGWA